MLCYAMLCQADAARDSQARGRADGAPRGRVATAASLTHNPPHPPPSRAQVHLKDESRRLGVRAFKALGVSYAIEKLFASGAIHAGDTIASMTDGNHGEALAVVARQRGLAAVVFVPHNVCPDRLAVMRLLGATLA